MKANHVLFSGFCAACLGACHFGPLWDFRTPADIARDSAGRCKSYTADKNPLLLSASLVEKVEPAIAHVASGPIQDEARLRGALIHLRPAPGLTREVLQRVVECHEVHVVLGTERELPYDPYTLPGKWLEIAADSEGDGFSVSVQTEEFATAQQVLARARRFVATNQ